jgi:hypothetical protein
MVRSGLSLTRDRSISGRVCSMRLLLTECPSGMESMVKQIHFVNMTIIDKMSFYAQKKPSQEKEVKKPGRYNAVAATDVKKRRFRQRFVW